MATPKILYQTWKTKNMPDKFKKNQRKWLDSLGILDDRNLKSKDLGEIPRSKDLGWSYQLLDDQDLRALVKTNFPQYLESYDSFTENIERVDFARYVMMYLGGVYADLDTYPMKSIEEPWVESGKIVLGREPVEHAKELYDGRDVVLCNAFMISPPRNKLWIDIMDFVIQHYEPNYKPVYNTGPMAMTLFMEAYPEKFKDVIITDPCIFFPMLGNGKFSDRCMPQNIYVVHEWDNTWVVPWYRDPRIFNRRYWTWGIIAVLTVLCLRMYNSK